MERGLERSERDVVQGDGDLGELGPEAALAAGEDACAHGGAEGVEAFEKLEKQIVRDGADEVDSNAAWTYLGTGAIACSFLIHGWIYNSIMPQIDC